MKCAVSFTDLNFEIADMSSWQEKEISVYLILSQLGRIVVLVSLYKFESGSYAGGSDGWGWVEAGTAGPAWNTPERRNA